MIEELLQQTIPDDLIQMQDLGRKLDAYRYEAYRDMVQKAKALTEAKNRNQLPKSSMTKITEADRKMHVEYRTIDEQADYDMAYGVYKIINDKINYIQTLAKAETEMFKRS